MGNMFQCLQCMEAAIFVGVPFTRWRFAVAFATCG